jgi:uncharacterized protein Veg
MADAKTVAFIREGIANNKQNQVSFSVKESRGRKETYTGTLEGAYKNIFVMSVKTNRRTANLAFNYSDIISGKVEFL